MQDIRAHCCFPGKTSSCLHPPLPRLLLFSIFTFNFLQTEGIDFVDGYSYFIVACLISLDWSIGWQTVFGRLQVTLQLLIWSATLLLPIRHCLCKMFVPEIYWRYRQYMRSQREELWKIINCRGEMGDVDTERSVEGGRVYEQTSLMADEGRTQMHGRT